MTHGRPPDGDASSLSARTAGAAGCAIQAIGALPRPPEDGDKVERHAKWADVDIEEDTVDSGVLTADHEVAGSTSDGQSADEPNEIHRALEKAAAEKIAAKGKGRQAQLQAQVQRQALLQAFLAVKTSADEAPDVQFDKLTADILARLLCHEISKEMSANCSNLLWNVLAVASIAEEKFAICSVLLRIRGQSCEKRSKRPDWLL